MGRQRYIIEGEWTGYRSSQQRIAHRTVHTDPKLREWVDNTYSIRYTDGTALILHTRDCKPRERIKMMNNYGKLIYECYQKGVSSVTELYAKKGAT